MHRPLIYFCKIRRMVPAVAAEFGLTGLLYPAVPAVAGIHRNLVASEPVGTLVGLAVVLEERSHLERDHQVEQKPAELLVEVGTH